MGRVSAIRNIKDAIHDLESGDADLVSAEQHVATALRAFATEFEDDAGDGTLDMWTAAGDDHAEGLAVLAAGADDTRTRVRNLLDEATDDVDNITFSAERARDDRHGDSGPDPTTVCFCRHRHRFRHPLVSHNWPEDDAVERFFFRLHDQSCVLLVVTYSQAAQTTLRDICRTHNEVVVRQLGRAALFDETELITFLMLRFREKHDENVQIEQIQPFNEFTAIPDAIREAAAACGDHKSPAIPYSKLASKIDHPPAAEVQHREL